MKGVMLFVVAVLFVSGISAQKGPVRSNHSVKQVSYSKAVRDSVARAVEYLRGLRQTDYGWGDPASTSRANVALAFAEEVSPMDDDEKDLMKKQLDIQLTLATMSPPSSLADQALYVNALYATCQDPRNFQGKDLVALLRSETTTRASRSENFTLPFVLLTLCMAGTSDPHDNYMLTNIYNKNERISTRALAVSAMLCVRRTKRSNLFNSYINNFIDRASRLRESSLDVYTKPLVMQALNAANQPNNFNLLKNQKEDGSFGDLLSTYYAIPALLNGSLQDLKCPSSSIARGMLSMMSEPAGKLESKKITISLCIPSDGSTFSKVVSFRGNATFYNVMKSVESGDPMFRFYCDSTNQGNEVFMLADIPNDPEKGMSWKLYKVRSESQPTLNKANWIEQNSGIDYLYPQDKSHYIFCYERS